MLYPVTRSDVPVRIMAISFHASYYIDAVRSLFKGMEDMKDIYFAGAWNDNNFNIRRILQSHGTCQVRSRISSETTTKRNNDRLEVFVHNSSFEPNSYKINNFY
jgi:hypothetical protein